MSLIADMVLFIKINIQVKNSIYKIKYSRNYARFSVASLIWH